MTAIGFAAAAALLVALTACQQGASTSPSEEITVYEGVPTIRDGDNVKIGGVNIRLLGIDACELGQPARSADTEIDCGIWARDHFRDMVGPRSVRCESTERDVYDRPLAICYTGQREINRALVENGYVFLYDRGSAYEAELDEARDAGRGIWLFEEVEHPSDYRRKH